MTDVSGAIFVMGIVYLLGEVVGFSAVWLVHRMGRRDRS